MSGMTNWDGLDRAGRAAKKARQGVRYAALEGLTVMDPDDDAAGRPPTARRSARSCSAATSS